MSGYKVKRGTDMYFYVLYFLFKKIMMILTYYLEYIPHGHYYITNTEALCIVIENDPITSLLCGFLMCGLVHFRPSPLHLTNPPPPPYLWQLWETADTLLM